MAAINFKWPPQFGRCSMSKSNTRLSRPPQLTRWRTMRVIGGVLGCLLRWTVNDRSTQRGAGVSCQICASNSRRYMVPDLAAARPFMRSVERLLCRRSSGGFGHTPAVRFRNRQMAAFWNKAAIQSLRNVPARQAAVGRGCVKTHSQYWSVGRTDPQGTSKRA